MESTYKVIYSGEILEGFNLNEVEAEFAKLFGVPVGKVSSYLKPKKVIKKDLTHARANIYKLKLEKIGLNIILEEEHASFAAMELELEANLVQAQSEREQEQPTISSTKKETPELVVESSKPKSFNIDTLSVMGLEDSQSEVESTPSLQEYSSVSSGLFSCPKCGKEQPKSDQCNNFSCGVFFHKFQQAAQENQFQEVDAIDETQDDSEELTLVDKLKPVIGGYVAAAIAMYVWITASIEFEINSTLPVILVGVFIGFVINILNEHKKDLRIISAAVAFSSLLIGSVLGVSILKDKGVELLKEQMALVEEIPADFQAQTYNQYISRFKKLHSDMHDKDLILGRIHQFMDLLALTQSKFSSKDSEKAKKFFNDYFYNYTYKHYMLIYDFLENENPSTSEISEKFNNFTYDYIEGYSSYEILTAFMSKLDWLLYVLASLAAFQIARPRYQ
ncbi:hypothetical protein [Marinicellulosiphila megalodicopiae]|uniref:hypothetical protein n=1 Tax=Marinicellulosiphila megalodicopiae TaxID=2724896 RepID=UPI003BAFF101